MEGNALHLYIYGYICIFLCVCVDAYHSLQSKNIVCRIVNSMIFTEMNCAEVHH